MIAIYDADEVARALALAGVEATVVRSDEPTVEDDEVVISKRCHVQVCAYGGLAVHVDVPTKGWVVYDEPNIFEAMRRIRDLGILGPDPHGEAT